MLVTSNIPLPFDGAEADQNSSPRANTRDEAGRVFAVDPARNVALQASAGTGKTRVLVDRYINLLRVGVDPSNILAITFTRKAATEMRDRILAMLREAAGCGDIPPARWRDLRDRLGDIAICTIDAFCLSLLREFPLEADVDPGFRMADDTEAPRLVDESLDRALRICRSLGKGSGAKESEEIALVFAQLGERRVRKGLATLLNRRLVAPELLSRYLASGPRDLTVADACGRAVRAVLDVFEGMPGGLDEFLATGPIDPAFELLRQDVRAAAAGPCGERDAVRLFTRVRDHFLTQEGKARQQATYPKAKFAGEHEWRRHKDAVVNHAAAIQTILGAYRRDLNVIVSRGVWRMFQIALTEYRRTLEVHGVLDFSDVLQRTLELLRQMDEFAQSRYRLESRYHHILVDEFQDTSRAQWELVSLLVRSWGEGAGVAHGGPVPPSIFIVGDPKQSIYGFRDADASILTEAGRFLQGLRPDRDVQRSISRSFRAVPALLSFVNDLCAGIDKASRSDAFRYEEDDRFPIDVEAAPERSEVLGMIAADTPEACAARAATEIQRLLAGATVRDRDTGIARGARPGDIAILFRTRDSHREFEDALERRGIPAYVYKGLGFFDADEIKDVVALLWYLAEPLSDRRAAALLRSRIVGISDDGLRRLAGHLADALMLSPAPGCCGTLDELDTRTLEEARAGVRRWLDLVDRLPPAEVLDRILDGTAYAYELRGVRLPQARENLKKIRSLVRRLQNRGYLTMGRVAAYIDRLSVGDESNAVIDALDAVNLMTVHASKGLEFPIVFVVNLARGTGNWRDPIRVSAAEGAPQVSVGDFQSDADEDSVPKDREETKRLLYVALTRARDRLYLASIVKDGRFQPGRGSLGEVVPSSLASLFPAASASDAPLPWGTHEFRVCTAESDAAVPLRETPVAGTDDRGPLADASPLPARAAVQPFDARARSVDAAGATSDRLVGLLVHRMLQRHGFGAAIDTRGRDALVRDLLRQDERAELEGAIETVAEMVLKSYELVCRRDDLRGLVEHGTAFREVPFTLDHEDGRIRGVIDCLVRGSDGRITVLEFKTGRERPEHAEQLEIYRKAACHLFPTGPVDARLIYVARPSIHPIH